LQSDGLLARMEAGEVYRLDELMELTGVTGTRLLPRLMELELAGLVTNTGSGFSRRLVT
jgi:predicted Rossmann fold nucleotide-binding protein DprA/Smf involved in DNA uptake